MVCQLGRPNRFRAARELTSCKARSFQKRTLVVNDIIQIGNVKGMSGGPILGVALPPFVPSAG
jgi:hypothetical protein